MTGVEADRFGATTRPYRTELLAHCYRMLGSLHDAEDLVQETYLRAWRGFDRFEGRSSVRVWLYKIATMACLTALGARRVLPSGLGPAATDRDPPLTEPTVLWLQPAPDALFHGSTADPATVVAARSGVRLAFIAALQELPARQRAVLILRDVLQMRADEAADILDASPASITSALQRARAGMAAARTSADELLEPEDPATLGLLENYTKAFEAADVPRLITLLREDVQLQMPPTATWFTGRSAVADFLQTTVLTAPGQWTLTASRANGAPAFLVEQRDGRGGDQAHGVQVLTIQGAMISQIFSFNTPQLVPLFVKPL